MIRAEMIGGPMDGLRMEVDDQVTVQTFRAVAIEDPVFQPVDAGVTVVVPSVDLLYRVLRKTTPDGRTVFAYVGERRNR